MPQRTRNPRNPENKPGDARGGDYSLRNRLCRGGAHDAAFDWKNNQPFLAGNAEFPKETRHLWAKKLIIFRPAEIGVDCVAFVTRAEMPRPRISGGRNRLAGRLIEPDRLG